MASSERWTSEMQLSYNSEDNEALSCSSPMEGPLVVFDLPRDVPSSSDCGSEFHSVSVQRGQSVCVHSTCAQHPALMGGRRMLGHVVLLRPPQGLR